jgi:hypothetical protein
VITARGASRLRPFRRYALPVGSGDGLATGAVEGSGWADVGDGTGVGATHVLALEGTGTGVAVPAAATGLALALGTGVDTAVGSGDATGEGAAVGTAVGQDWLVGTGSGVAGIPVGLAEGVLTVAEALGVADALAGAFLAA